MVPDDAIELPDGSVARRVGDAVELRDARDRLVFRFRDGEAELMAPEGDLKLCAPNGAVVIESATDIALHAGRDILHEPSRRVDLRTGDTHLRLDPRKAALRTDTVEVVANKSELTTGAGRLIAEHVQASAQSIVTRVERYELEAGRLVERSRDAFREVSDLLQTKSGRVRNFVEGVYATYTGRTVMVSDKDTSIDGQKVLLG